jgi:hypothetical protein
LPGELLAGALSLSFAMTASFAGSWRMIRDVAELRSNRQIAERKKSAI